MNHRTAATGEFKVMLRGPENNIDLALEPDVDAPTVFFFDRITDTIRFVKEQQGRDLYYFSFDDDRGFVTTQLDSVKVYQQGQDKSEEFRQFISSRTAEFHVTDGHPDPAVQQCIDSALDNVDMTLSEHGLNRNSDDPRVDEIIKETWRSSLGMAEEMYGAEVPAEVYNFFGSRTAAEPGGVLPWTPSDNGYYWISKNEDSLEAVTNDGISRMVLRDKGYGWTWEVRDSQGLVERGNFSGMSGDALRDRADQLLAEFDTHAQMRTRGPSRGYQDDYTPAPNELWGHRASTSDRYREVMTRRGVRHVDSGYVPSSLMWEAPGEEGAL